MTTDQSSDLTSAPSGGTLLYRLADSWVLIGVLQTPQGPQPLVTQIGDQVCAVAYTDAAELESDLPEGWRSYQIAVPEFLAQLPPMCGLLINPRAKSPILVAPEQREAVIAAAQPFPAGAEIRIKQGGVVHDRLMAAALPALQAQPALRRLYSTRYQVADCREKLLLAYDVDAAAGTDAAAADALYEAAAAIQLSEPMQIVSLEDVPETFRRIILADVPACYVREDLRSAPDDAEAGSGGA